MPGFFLPRKSTWDPKKLNSLPIEICGLGGLSDDSRRQLLYADGERCESTLARESVSRTLPQYAIGNESRNDVGATGKLH